MSFIPPAKELYKLRALKAEKGGTDFVFAWERDNGRCFRFSIPFPTGMEQDKDVIVLAERAVKFVLWAAGGWKLHMAGPDAICAYIEAQYSAGGARDFDRDMMFKSYGKEMEIIRTRAIEIPETKDNSEGAGVSWKGCRIGFDLGASDFKISAVEDGEVKFSDEFPWDPRNATDPEYHFSKLNEGLKLAASHLPRVDAIGGSTAGIVVDNQMRVASLFRAIVPEKYAEAQQLFKRVQKEWNVPVHVENDGDVTALAAYLTSGSNGVLGVAMGSSEAVGFIDKNGAVTGRLNELAFATADLDENAPADEWSGDTGVGAMYFSQQAVNHLAVKAGVEFSADMPLPERLLKVQAMMKENSPIAEELYKTIGMYLGHNVAWYHEFYDFDSLLILGRVTTGQGGEIILETARKIVAEEYPELANVQITMPDEKAKRLGQSVAAAALV